MGLVHGDQFLACRLTFFLAACFVLLATGGGKIAGLRLGQSPFGDRDDREPLAQSSPCANRFGDDLTSYGNSGIKMVSAPPAKPAPRASQPARCPMISTTMIRLWLVAVEWSLSIASVAISNAVSKPKVTSVLRHVVVDRLWQCDHLKPLSP